jgi:hypothetical protein
MADIKWCELITHVYETQPQESGIANKPAFYPAASLVDIAVAENQLAVKLPMRHRSLLLETNGVMDMLSIDGGEWFKSGWFLWPLDKILEENLEIRSDDNMRERYMPLDCFLFFADAGNGDLFAYSVVSGEIRYGDVFAWRHENDSRPNIAPSLVQFIEGWKDGRIRL